MTTSDLRLLVESVLRALARRDVRSRRLAAFLGGVIAAFCVGAGVAAATAGSAGRFTLLVLVAPLLVVLWWVRLPALRRDAPTG